MATIGGMVSILQLGTQREAHAYSSGASPSPAPDKACESLPRATSAGSLITCGFWRGHWDSHKPSSLPDLICVVLVLIAITPKLNH